VDANRAPKMNPNSWVILRSLMSRPAFQALVARMSLWVQSSNHPRPTFISLDTPTASAKRAARFAFAARLPARVQKTTSCFAGWLTAHSPMLAPCVRAWLLSRHVKLSANPTGFDIQPCSTQGGVCMKGKGAEEAAKKALFARDQ
jgi:hypothetical protein